MRYEKILETLIDHRGYDLQGKFDYYNRLCFQGMLPRIPLKFTVLKGLAGKYTCKWTPQADRAHLKPRLRAIGGVLRPNSIKIVLDRKYLRREQEIDSTLIHEMIHAWFFLQNNFVENHGLNFIQKARECEAKVGFKIPLTERIDNPVFADVPLRKLVVLLWERPRETLYAIINPTSFLNFKDSIGGEWLRSGDAADRLSAFEVRSPAWSQKAMRVPVQRPVGLYGRRGKGRVAFYYARDPDLIQDLRDNGKPLFVLQNGGR